MAKLHWTIKTVKMYDGLRTDDLVEYTYMMVTFRAKITIDGMLATRDIAQPNRATLMRDASACYEHPTNFTQDCVDEYWHRLDQPNLTRTNPNGWIGVRLVRTGQSLDYIRRRLADEYDDVTTTTTQIASSSSDASNDATMSVEAMRASGMAPRFIASRLESHCNQLTATIDRYEQLIERLTIGGTRIPDDDERIRRQVHAILNERKRQIALIDAVVPVVAVPPTKKFRALPSL